MHMRSRSAAELQKRGETLIRLLDPSLGKRKGDASKASGSDAKKRKR